MSSINQSLIIPADHSFMDMDTVLHWVLYWVPWRQTLKQCVRRFVKECSWGHPHEEIRKAGWVDIVGLQWDCNGRHSSGAVLPGNDMEIWAERFIVPSAITRRATDVGPQCLIFPVTANRCIDSKEGVRVNSIISTELTYSSLRCI